MPNSYRDQHFNDQKLHYFDMKLKLKYFLEHCLIGNVIAIVANSDPLNL